MVKRAQAANRGDTPRLPGGEAVAALSGNPATGMVIAATKRLLLRPLHLGDADAMGRVFGDVEVMRYGDGVKTPGWVRKWIAQWTDDLYDRWGFGMWAVVENPGTVNSGGAVLGYCGLSRFPERCAPGETELGYRLARAHWGRGFATEAGRAVRDYAFGTLRLPRLIALIDPQNAPSIRVADKIGFRYDRDAMLEGYDHPDRVYALDRPAGATAKTL
jgi:ribosomal-protein-alanine N-acetyltransferase